MLAAITWDLSAWDVLLRLVAGLVIGFTIGLTGIGGGVLVMPTLIRLFGFLPSLAVPTANLFAALARSHATYEHLKLDTLRRRTAFWFLVGGVPVDIAVTCVLRLNRSRVWIDPEGLESGLRVLVIAVMAVAGVAQIVNMVALGNKTEDDHYKPTPMFEASRKLKSVLCGALIGFLIGSTSVGGGVIVIPMLAALFALSPRDTVGTSNGISIVLALVSTTSFFVGNPDVPWAASMTTAVLMFVGSIAGVRVGSRLAVRMPARLLYGIITFLILVAIVSMVLKGGGGAA